MQRNRAMEPKLASSRQNWNDAAHSPMSLPQLLSRLVVLLFLPLLSVRASPDWPLPATTPVAAGLSPERLDMLHRNLGAEVDAGRYSGYILMLARDGRIVDWRAHGWQEVANRTPMQKDSIVRIYSMSKIVTSVAVLMLMEEGKLKLADPVEKFLPGLKNRQVLTGGTADAPMLAPAARPVTIRDLLTHTAGYYYDAEWSAGSPVAIELFKRAKVWEAANLDEFVNRVALLPLAEQPGTRFRYGISIDLLGAIVEKASGLRLDQFFAQRIFSPLGLRDTGFWVPAEKRSRLALVHARGPDGKLAAVPPDPGTPAGPDRGLLSGGGGLYSTAGDYVRFAQMLLNGGQLDGVRLLGPKTVELMTRNHIAHLADPHPFGRAEMGFGLGVRMVTDLGRSPLLGSAGMFGWDGAATSLVWMDPQERLVALVLFQHFPFDQDNIFAPFTNGVYSALEK